MMNRSDRCRSVQVVMCRRSRPVDVLEEAQKDYVMYEKVMSMKEVTHLPVPALAESVDAPIQRCPKLVESHEPV